MTEHGRMSGNQSDLEHEVFDTQIRMLYEHVPIVLTTNVVNAGIIALVLATYMGESDWWLFFGAISVLSAVRAVFYMGYVSGWPRPSSSHAWATLGTASSAFSGLIWGGGAGLLLSDSMIEQTFLAFVVGGMCAGALVSLAYHLPAFIAYVLPATIPLAARFSLTGRPVYFAMATMVILFAAALTVAAYNFRRYFVNSVRLQIQLRQRSEELIVANDRLRAEVSDHRATENRLHQSRKMEAMGQLTGGIAHDFNNLLTAVIGNLELAQRRTVGDLRLSSMLEAALAAAQRGATLTQRLLAFARRQHLEPKTVDVPAVVNDAARLLQPTVGPAIQLVIEAEANLPPARVDPGQLELAILNLALNARDAMPGGGTLRIRTEVRRGEFGRASELIGGDYVVVSVSDTGIGMDAQMLERAFDPFFTTKEVGRGSGLGLPMVQGFAAQSDGAVQLESAPGQGTKAELWLPCAEQPSAEGEPPSHPTIKTSAPARILVCDDEQGVREFVSDVLRDSGHTVWSADGPVAALEILQKQRVDLLLVDYAMPEMNGATVIEHARLRQPKLKLLMMTGDAEALRTSPVVGVPLLPKPFKIAQLKERVAESLVAD